MTETPKTSAANPMEGVDIEERKRVLAYSIWEEEGRPEGQSEAHWLKACAIIEAEMAEAEAIFESLPDWLKRGEGTPAAASVIQVSPVAAAPASTSPLEEIRQRVAGRAAG